MLHPPVEQLELDPRHSEEHREEEQRHCARITELQQLPGGPVDAIYDHIGGAERPTARQHHDERQHLERADDSGHQHEQRHGPEPARASTRLINTKSGWYIHCFTKATATTEEA